MYGIKGNLDALKKAIEIAGGVTNLALKAGVSYQTILNWKNGRNTIHPLNCEKIEKATEGKVTKRDLLPDYPWKDNELK